MKYELTVVCKDEAYDKAISKLLNVFEGDNAKVLKYENEGRKRLAYSIRGREWCTYAHFEIEMDSVNAGILSSEIDHIDAILRYLFVKGE